MSSDVNLCKTNWMVLGLGSFTYGWSIGMELDAPGLGELDLINRTAKLGLKCLQVCDNLPLHNLPGSRLQEFKASAIDNKIRLEVGARKLTEDHLQRYLEITQFLKAPLLRFVVDENEYRPSNQTIIAILKNILPELKKNNVTLGIENHDRFKAKELASIIESIADDRIGICLDCVNSIGAGEGLEWVANILAPYTVNLHIKDYRIQRFNHNMGFIVAGAPAGTGMMDLPWLMEKLAHYKRCQSAILEQWVVPEATRDLTIEKENLWADQGIKYLKQLPYFKANNL